MQRRWDHALVLLDFAMTCADDQIARGAKFVFEHPSGASSWKQESVKRVRNRAGVYEVVFDQCTFGLVTKVPSCSCTIGVSILSDPSVRPQTG